MCPCSACLTPLTSGTLDELNIEDVEVRGQGNTPDLCNFNNTDFTQVCLGKAEREDVEVRGHENKGHVR